MGAEEGQPQQQRETLEGGPRPITAAQFLSWKRQKVSLSLSLDPFFFFHNKIEDGSEKGRKVSEGSHLKFVPFWNASLLF